jgi:RNA polymerase sigma-70 factor, ECF subfamily
MDQMESRSDAELLKLAVVGEERAFLLLYERLKYSIFRYAYYMTGSRTAAEEVLQEVFMALLREADNYREQQGEVSGFAFGIAKNIVRRIRRRERAYESLAGVEPTSQINSVSEADSLTAQAVRNEQVERLQAAIASLPDHYRQAVVLCDLCELSYAEAAARLRCSVGTIRSRLNRAHILLAKKLKPLNKSRMDLQVSGEEGCLI